MSLGQLLAGLGIIGANLGTWAVGMRILFRSLFAQSWKVIPVNFVLAPLHCCKSGAKVFLVIAPAIYLMHPGQHINWESGLDIMTCCTWACSLIGYCIERAYLMPHEMLPSTIVLQIANLLLRLIFFGNRQSMLPSFTHSAVILFIALVQYSSLIVPQYWSERMIQRFYVTQKRYFTKAEADSFAMNADSEFMRVQPIQSIPSFGKFTYFQWNPQYSGYSQDSMLGVPIWVRSTLLKMCSLVPEQKFDHIFLQRYDKGCQIGEHRDPMNTQGVTVIGVFGNFKGGNLVIEGANTLLESGDVLVMRSRIGKNSMPLHRVETVTEGHRYALIASTISLPPIKQ